MSLRSGKPQNDMFKVTVEYYGVLEDVCGTRSEEFRFGDEAVTVADALTQLAARHSGLRRHREHIACALDDELARNDAILRDGSVLALLPPVSGG